MLKIKKRSSSNHYNQQKNKIYSLNLVIYDVLVFGKNNCSEICGQDKFYIQLQTTTKNPHHHQKLLCPSILIQVNICQLRKTEKRDYSSIIDNQAETIITLFTRMKRKTIYFLNIYIYKIEAKPISVFFSGYELANSSSNR